MAEKRKGLMSILSDYQREEKQKRDYSAKKKPNLSKKASGAKSNTKAAFGGKSLMPKTSKPASGAKTKATPPKPVPQQKKVEKKKPEAKKTEQKKGNGDGTYGKSMPSNPKVGITMAPRKKRPGTGRTGEAAAKAANRKPTPKKTMTAAQRRAMRLKARRGR